MNETQANYNNFLIIQSKPNCTFLEIFLIFRFYTNSMLEKINRVGIIVMYLILPIYKIDEAYPNKKLYKYS